MYFCRIPGQLVILLGLPRLETMDMWLSKELQSCWNCICRLPFLLVVHPCAIRTSLFESLRLFVACDLPLLSVELTCHFPRMEKLQKRVFWHVREILYTLYHSESPSLTLYLFCRDCRELQWSCIYVKIRNKTVKLWYISVWILVTFKCSYLHWHLLVTSKWVWT